MVKWTSRFSSYHAPHRLLPKPYCPAPCLSCFSPLFPYCFSLKPFCLGLSCLHCLSPSYGKFSPSYGKCFAGSACFCQTSDSVLLKQIADAHLSHQVSAHLCSLLQLPHWTALLLSVVSFQHGNRPVSHQPTENSALLTTILVNLLVNQSVNLFWSISFPVVF